MPLLCLVFHKIKNVRTLSGELHAFIHFVQLTIFVLPGFPPITANKQLSRRGLAKANPGE